MNNNDEGFLRLRSCADARMGGLIGLLVGDALGVSFEFKPPNLLPLRDKIEMQPPLGFRKSHAGVPVGTWSDDGAQALCLLASLADCGQFSLADFADRLVRWLDDGYMAVDRVVFDCGIQTAAAIGRLRDGASPYSSGGESESDNGNGSLMRVLPLAVWHTGSDEALVRDAHAQSLPTHAHSRSLVACAYTCLVARGYLSAKTDPWTCADQCLEEIYNVWHDERERGGFLNELEVLRRFPKTQPRGTGYVLDTIWSARKALEEESFEHVARRAILFGHDTDTTAAVACGLAGIRFGIEGIPVRWMARLRGFEIVEPLLARLIARPDKVTTGP
ncbi:ADP-ribosylglycohydrolase family protein [Paraburkholderia fungorum]|uniref:ADP-ribosylglycohydrolase family protein n=1 Tax=Paraburkholderia fungorum TaxID=134537 RepID=A0AAP5Q8I6_9BURK|nr:ADP-ribosylglycohydrolase family protein [Paraburkholderia fungorum]MDT8837800.1 ADP-ribosylglycohydrolase family protein [Paraburkholderia fungorum]